MNLPDPALVFLVGPAGSGKSTWAAERFLAEEIVSSDGLRAVVGSGPADLDASDDAFRLLRDIVAARLGRGLTTVIDTTGLDPVLRGDCREWARNRGLPAVVVLFDAPLEVCLARNANRVRPVPVGVLRKQEARYRSLRPGIASEGWDSVVVVDGDAAAEVALESGDSEPVTRMGIDFVLHVSRFPWPHTEAAERLGAIATAAEEAGFAGLSVMDHLVQIPQVGRPWEDIPEPYLTLGFLAGRTSRLELGTLVTNSTLRNVGLLAKMTSTLDVLSGGRSFCGIGAGWNVAEERAYGFPEVSVSERLDRLEDAARLLPLMWGKGAVSFEGRTASVVEAVSYPRPVRGRIPLIVGGAGEQRTLRIAARYADGVNVIGDSDTVRHKRAVLDRHCEAAGRDPAEVEMTVLDVTLVGEDRRQVADLVEAHRGRLKAATYAARVSAGTVEAQSERYRSMAEAGVSRVFVAMPDLTTPDEVHRFGAVISKLRT